MRGKFLKLSDLGLGNTLAQKIVGGKDENKCPGAVVDPSGVVSYHGITFCQKCGKQLEMLCPNGCKDPQEPTIKYGMRCPI